MRIQRKTISCLLIMLAMLLVQATLAAAVPLTPKQQLGELLYNDLFLSLNANQACATCHAPPGFADPANAADPINLPVSQGSDGISFGGRNAPSAAYASFSPFFYWDAVAGVYTGGQFWDGRANTLKDQAMGPFLNPVEMAMPTAADVLKALQTHPFTAIDNPNWPAYQAGFQTVFGVDLTTLDLTNDVAVDAVFAMLAEAIGDFEKSWQVTPFTSKYDAWLAGQAQLTAQEEKGMKLFTGKGKCNLCHLSTPQLSPDGVNMIPPLFTDFTYDNLGIPKSTNVLLINNAIDYGLGARPDIAVADPIVTADGQTVSASQAGKFKVPTLRNIANTAPYGHNGYFATLTDIVNFYNTAAVAGMWPPPEVSMNVNRAELGDLHLTTDQVADLVAFMQTLSDGFMATPITAPFFLPPMP